MKFHCSKTNTFCLAAIHVKVNLLHFLSQWSSKEHVRKNLKKITRGLQLSCGGPECLLALSGISLRCLRGPWGGSWPFNGPTPSTRSSSWSLCQGGWGKSACPPGFRKSLSRRGKFPDTSTVYGLNTYQPTIDTLGTVYSSFYWICVWPAKTFGGHCIYVKIYKDLASNRPSSSPCFLLAGSFFADFFHFIQPMKSLQDPLKYGSRGHQHTVSVFS
jgi:hypothetical protein